MEPRTESGVRPEPTRSMSPLGLLLKKGCVRLAVSTRASRFETRAPKTREVHSSAAMAIAEGLAEGAWAGREYC